MAGEILLRQLGDGAGEKQQGDQVGDGHQAVEGVGDIPHQRAGADGAHDAHEHEDDVEDAGHDLAAPAQIAPAAGPVIAPADDGGQGEEQQADLDDDAPADNNILEEKNVMTDSDAEGYSYKDENGEDELTESDDLLGDSDDFGDFGDFDNSGDDFTDIDGSDEDNF